MGRVRKHAARRCKQQQQQQQQQKQLPQHAGFVVADDPAGRSHGPERVAELVAAANDHVDECQFDLAAAAFEEALTLDPANAGIHEAAGVTLMELGKPDEAKRHFEAAVVLQPDEGYSKYMYLGQLSVSAEAVAAFQRGVDLMAAQLENLKASAGATVRPEAVAGGSGAAAENGDAEAPLPSLARKISSALVAMTEIYLTDLCMEPDAASRCESYLLQAAAVDASNPEVYQTLASVRLSQERHADARAAVAQSIQIWKDLEKDDPAIPSYESRINLVKILLELSQCREALFVLGRLQEEDEKVVDLWYLFGYTYYLLAVDGETGELPAAPDNTVSPQFAADGEGAGCSDPAAVSPAAAVRLAWDFFRSTLKWHRELDSGDIGILEHTRELMASIRSVLPDVEEGEEEEPEEDEDRDEQGTDDGSEWENLSDDEGDDMVDA